MALPKLSVPQYKVQLPSTGNDLNMRPFLVKEEKVLMIALESNDMEQISKAVRDIILSCYDLDSLEDLTVFDIEYLFLQLRAKSVGENMNIQIKCTQEECDGLTPISINVDDVEIINQNQERTILLDEKTGVGVTMKYPSMELIGSLDIEKLNSVEGVMELIIKCIDSIFDNDNVFDADTESAKDLEQFVESLNSEQFRMIQGFLQEVPAVYYKTEYECDKCKHTNEVELRGLNSFFT
jgi:hypothetical protein